jgi:regulation of enolase protein 1 (concanavalin A-like superfamily)
VPWSAGRWLNEPALAEDGDDLLVTAARGSDFWRTTSYGFVRDSGHALLGRARGRDPPVEVSFLLDYDGLYDQAGVLVRVDERTWVEGGVEISDGLPQLGAVVTREVSDWSVAPVPDWVGRVVTVRVSRSMDALTIRARVDDEPLRLVRLAPLGPLHEQVPVLAGPMCCAPERAGLQVRFTGWWTGPADTSLH